MFYRAAILGMMLTVLTASLPVRSQTSSQTPAPPPLPAPPQNCELLALVGGQGSEVTKEVSPPTLPIPLPGPFGTSVRNNWNTDWAVPGGTAFSTYFVTFMPLNTGRFNVQMFLKYSDGTADRFYNEQAITLNANEIITVETRPRTGTQPYQVNLMVGGADIIGRRYSASVAGCR